MAQAAALRDPRFSPVTEDELDELELEISVLTPIQEVKDINSIEVGKDGLIIRRGNFQGLLLPQVASEYGWDRETFLAQTCRKAGLPLDAWKLEDTEISAFRAEVFGEE
jgi:AmmeMemoRadiSam system protein A